MDPADNQDPNHPPADNQDRNHPPADNQDPNHPPADIDQNNPPIHGQMLHGQHCEEIVPHPFPGGYRPTFCDHASFIRSLEERETRREEKITKLQENLSKITDKLNVAKRNIATLKREKKLMETSHDAVLRRTAGNIKRKFVKGCKKWVDKKNDEFGSVLQYSQMRARLKLIKHYRAGKLDLKSEETKLKLGVALLTGSFLDDSDEDPPSSDDDASPSGTAQEPDADSYDDGSDE